MNNRDFVISYTLLAAGFIFFQMSALAMPPIPAAVQAGIMAGCLCILAEIYIRRQFKISDFLEGGVTAAPKPVTLILKCEGLTQWQARDTIRFLRQSGWSGTPKTVMA